MSSVDRRSDTHTIHVKNLQLPAGVEALDIWGLQKVQPALLTVELVLRTNFNSAASLDALDESTIHYGHLCKNIRSACSTASSVQSTLQSALHAIEGLAKKKDTFIVSQASLLLTLPKASAYGKSITISQIREYQQDGVTASDVLTISYRELQIMTLVGVNDQERTGQQAIILTCDIVSKKLPDQITGLERSLIETVQPFTFQTLEALAVESIQKIQEKLVQSQLAEDVVELRLLFEKPSAVVFADAPAIEIRRRF